MISQERLKEVLHYEEQTGAFTWIESDKSGYIKEANKVGTLSSRGYLRVGIDGKKYYLQRLAWLYVHGAMPDGFIDHINGDSLDNSICNLRLTNNSGNIRNQRKPHRDNITKRLGVTWDARAGKYRANINHNKIRYHLGCFDDPDEAHQAYLDAKRRLHETCTI
jgi:hypothetical protein